ncbi:exported hypothetical protein [metagenome]|uniref:Uncharacterized protein n=1 Tax=metagenome TaxID=256318 RepID=A0A2P2BYG4_9ZZZZ
MFLTRSSRSRRLSIVAAIAGAATAGIAWPAQAQAPTRIDAEYWGVDCVYALSGGETLFLFGSGTTNGTEGGIGGFVEDANGQSIAEGFTSTFVYGETFYTSLDFENVPFSIHADLTPGPAETMPVMERSGNSWTKGTITQTQVEVHTTTASYGAQELDLSGGSCASEITAFDVLTTDPSATIYRDEDFDSAICAVEGLPDAEVRVTGLLPDGYVEVVLDHGAAGAEKARGEIPLRGGDGTLVTEVVDVFTGVQTATATIEVELERAGPTVRQVEKVDGSVERRTFTPYHEAISVRFSDGRQGNASCFGVATTTHIMIAPE